MFLRTTTAKLIGLACVWVLATRIGLFFVNQAQSPGPVPSQEMAVTVPAGGEQWMPFVVHYTAKADAPLRMRLQASDKTKIRLLVFDESGFLDWNRGRPATPLHDSRAEMPADIAVHLPAPTTIPPEGVRRTYYMVFSNRDRAAKPQTFQASVWLGGRRASESTPAQRALFVGLLLVAMVGTALAALWRRQPQLKGEFYTLPRTRPRG